MGVDHPFAHREHFNHRGEPCHCPWGHGGKHQQERLGALKEASKLEWLQERPDMQSPEAQQFLSFIQGKGIDGGREPSRFSGPTHAEADKMLPWLVREWKKGRLKLPNDPLYDGRLIYEGSDGLAKHLNGGDLVEVQSTLEEMKKRRKGIDAMQHQVHELMPKVKEFQDWKKSQERKDLGDTLHTFDNGWTIRRLQNEDEHVDEGQMMGHCVGDRSMGYMDQTERGSRIFASLRDHKNIPHATIEMSPDHWRRDDGSDEISESYPGGPANGWIPQVGPDSEIYQFYGKEDAPPLEEYTDRVNEWLQPHGIEADPGQQQDADVIYVPGVTDTSDYLDLHGENFDPYEWGYDQDEEGRPAGENTEWDHDIPKYDSIAEDILRTEGDERISPDALEDVFNLARQRYEIGDFDYHLNQAFDPTNASHGEILDEWEKLKEPHYHPYTGELSQGYGPPVIEDFQKPLFTPNHVPLYPISLSDRFERNEDGTVKRDESGQPIQAPPVQGPQLSPYIYAGTTKPFYYRWVFSPTKGVTLGSNEDDHPALVPYHQGLGGKVDGQDLRHGYAYRLGNGWRLTDWEHKAVEDPFIFAQVVRALGLKENPEMAAEGSWHPVKEANWDRLHYGLPATELS